MRRLAALAPLAALGLAACSTQPAITSERTTLTPAQIAEMGLECRKETALGTTIPRNVCASPAAWARYDADGADDTQRVFNEIGIAPNDRFNNRLGSN